VAFFRINSKLFAKDVRGWRSASMWCAVCWHQWEAHFHRLTELDLVCPVCEAKIAVPPMRKWYVYRG